MKNYVKKQENSMPLKYLHLNCSIFASLFFNIYLFLIAWWLVYNIGLISTWIYHRYIYVPFFLSLPPTTCLFPPLGYYRAPIWVPWVIQQIPTGYLFTYVGVYASMLLSPFISPFSPPPLSISLFSLCLHCCSANRSFSTILLDSIHMC